MTLPDVGESFTICEFVSIHYQSVTDRPDGFATAISRSAFTRMLTRDKNTVAIET